MITKGDINSFFTASGQTPLTHRVIDSMTNDWTENAELALFGQTPSGQLQCNPKINQ